jgi:hypothetical protein
VTIRVVAASLAKRQLDYDLVETEESAAKRPSRRRSAEMPREGVEVDSVRMPERSGKKTAGNTGKPKGQGRKAAAGTKQADRKKKK